MGPGFISFRGKYFCLLVATIITLFFTVGLQDSFAGGTVTTEIYSCPSSVKPGQAVDVQVRIKFQGDDNDGPWQVTDLDLNEDDPVDNDTYSALSNPFKIYSQGVWYYHTFRNVVLTSKEDDDRIELFAWAEVDDNDWNGYNPDDSSPVKYVSVPKSGDIISASPDSFSGNSKTVTVSVKNNGYDKHNLIVECSGKPSGWSVSPSSKQTRVPYGTTNSSYFTFTVTPPSSYNSSGNITWKLYYDDPGTTNNTWLDTYYQSVSNSVPSLERTPSSLDFGSTSTKKSISVRNKNGGQLNYTVSSNRSWIDINPTMGSSTGEWDTINIYVDRSDLSAGTKTGTVYVNPNYGSTQNVSVSMVVPTIPTSLVIEGNNSIPEGQWYNYKAYAAFNDGRTRVDVTNYVDWHTNPSTYAYMDPSYKGRVRTKQITSDKFFNLTASYVSNGKTVSASKNNIKIIDVPETIYPPSSITGPSSVFVGEWDGKYIASGGSTSDGHPVQYQYDWGDGSELSIWSDNGLYHKYDSPGPYKIRAKSRCKDHPTLKSDLSGYLHTVTAIHRPIRVVYPNGGEEITAGQKKNITWTYTAAAGSSVKIELYKGGSYLSTISSSTSNDGIYEWPVPLTLAAGTDYQIKITSVSNPAHDDSSDGAFYVIAPPPIDNATIISFSPPTGTLQRGTQATATVRVKNTGTTTRRFWVGLSFAEPDSGVWPDGWFDVQPLETLELNPGESQTVTFNFEIPEWLDPGLYTADTAVWDGYDRIKHEMTMPPAGQPFAAQRSVPSFKLSEFTSSMGSVLEQLLIASYKYKALQAGEENVWTRYDDGEKVLLYVSAPSVLSGIASVFNVPVSISNPTVLIDMADLMGVTPEGQNGKVTVWVDGKNAVEWSQDGSPIGFGLTVHKFDSTNTADVRDQLIYDASISSILGVFPFELSWQYSPGDGLKWPKFEWTKTFDVQVGVSQTRESLKRIEVDRSDLQSAFLSATDQMLGTGGLELFVEYLFKGFVDIKDNWQGTDDDGNWKPNTPTNLWPEKGALGVPTGPVLWGSPYQDHNGDLLLSARFQIDDDSDFSSPVYDNENIDDTIELPEGFLDNNTRYYWRTCYKDSRNAWSNWSTPTDFTTIPDGVQLSLTVMPGNREVSISSGSTSFTVSNAGSGTMEWSAQVVGGESWLSITSGTSGTDDGEIQASFTSNTSAKFRIGTIRITAAGASGSPTDVTLTQVGMGSVLEPSIAKNQNNIDMGTTSQDVVFDVWNDSDATLNYTVEVTEGSEYFSVSPNSGSSIGMSDVNTHTVYVHRDLMVSGQAVIGRIKIYSPDADDSPQYVNLSASRSEVVIYDPDINMDGQVDLKDFGILSSKWLDSSCLEINNWCDRADIDQSGAVGIEDLAILASYWQDGVEIPTIAPIAHWTLDDNFDDVLVSEGASNTYAGLASSNTDTFSDVGVIDGCLNFGGTELVTVADDDVFSFGNGATDSPFSISAWVYVSGTGTYQIIGKNMSDINGEWLLRIANGNLFFLCIDDDADSYIFTKSTPVTSGWHHVAATYDGSGVQDGMNIYVDKSLAVYNKRSYGTYTAMDAGGDYPVAIGGRNDIWHLYNEKLDDVAIYSKELSASEVAGIYNAALK